MGIDSLFNYIALTHLLSGQFWAALRTRKGSPAGSVFHLSLLSFWMWWYLKCLSNQDDSWRLPLAWMAKSEWRVLRFWSKSRLPLKWPAIILSLLLCHDGYWTPDAGTSDCNSRISHHKLGVTWFQNQTASNIQKHFLTIECGICKTDWAGLNFLVCLLLPFLSEPTFIVSWGSSYGS